MKKALLFLALAATANAGVVRFAAKTTYHAAKFGVKATKKVAHVAYKVAF